MRWIRIHIPDGHPGHWRSVMGHSDLDPAVHERRPWNSGKNVGPKRPSKPRVIWAIRYFLDGHKRLRDRALFDLAIHSKRRGCDLVKLKIGDLVSGGSFRERATVIQQKTGRPVQFEILTEARKSLEAWLRRQYRPPAQSDGHQCNHRPHDCRPGRKRSGLGQGLGQPTARSWPGDIARHLAARSLPGTLSSPAERPSLVEKSRAGIFTDCD